MSKWKRMLPHTNYIPVGLTWSFVKFWRQTQHKIKLTPEYPILCVYINNVESNFLVVAGAEICAISEELIKRNS